MNTLQRILAAAAVLMLAVVVLAQLLPKKDAPFFTPPQPLSKLVPPTFSGWGVEDRELGETEFMREQVKGILRYDDAFFRVYKRENIEVGVYAAYWGPGRIHPIDAATHSPDLCWVNAGWTEKRHDYEHVLDDGAGQALKIAQFREFDAPGAQRQEVVFWHLMGGRLSGYALGPSRRWQDRLPVLWDNQISNRFGLLRREQYFIRISTNGSIEDLKREPLWAEIMKGLAQTGLRERDTKE